MGRRSTLGQELDLVDLGRGPERPWGNVTSIGRSTSSLLQQR